MSAQQCETWAIWHCEVDFSKKKSKKSGTPHDLRRIETVTPAVVEKQQHATRIHRQQEKKQNRRV